MKHFNLIHNTEAWMKARGGLATTSSFGKIITPSGGKSKSMEPYANRVVCELLLGKSCDRDLSNMWAMAWGHEWEGKAADLYQFETGYDLKHGGFYTDDDFKRGASPDAKVFDAEIQIGTAEIKCPEDPVNHVNVLFSNKIPPKHKAQVFGHMHVTGFDRVDFFSFYPEMPHALITTHKSDDIMFYDNMVELLDEFDALVQTKLESMMDCGHINEIPVKFIETTKESAQPEVQQSTYMAG